MQQKCSRRARSSVSSKGNKFSFNMAQEAAAVPYTQPIDAEKVLLYRECQNRLFRLQIKQVKLSVKASLRIFIFASLAVQFFQSVSLLRLLRKI